MAEQFKAMIVEKQPEKTFTRRIGERALSDLPEGPLLIKVRRTPSLLTPRIASICGRVMGCL